MPRRRLTPGLLSTAAAVALLVPAAPAWTPTLEVGTGFNDNANYATRQQKSDTATTASLDISRLRGLNGDWQFLVGARAQTSAWWQYSGLNLTELGAQGLLRRKFGLGPYAPRLDLRAGFAHQFSRVGGWSGNWLRAGTALHRRFTPQWEASLAGEYNRLYAHRDVYAIATRSVSARVDFDPDADWRLSLSLRYLGGDQLSWCRASWPQFAGTHPWLDGIFGGDWFPYQERAHQVAASLDLARALGPRTTIALGGDVSHARSAAGHIYRRQILRLQLIHAF
ncbi:MAG TPA: hypothetical protein VHE13_13790 [Opitutus sp.]|nr:hypothetical protein [Opitutus sp.]